MDVHTQKNDLLWWILVCILGFECFEPSSYWNIWIKLWRQFIGRIWVKSCANIRNDEHIIMLKETTGSSKFKHNLFTNLFKHVPNGQTNMFKTDLCLCLCHWLTFHIGRSSVDVGPLANLVERLAKQNILLARIWQPITSCTLWQLPILSSSSAMLRKQHESCFMLFPPQKWRPTASWQYDWWFVKLWEQPNWWPPRPKSPACHGAHLVLEGPFGDVRNLRGARTKNVQRKLKCENAWECVVAGQPAGLASK